MYKTRLLAQGLFSKARTGMRKRDTPSVQITVGKKPSLEFSEFQQKFKRSIDVITFR